MTSGGGRDYGDISFALYPRGSAPGSGILGIDGYLYVRGANYYPPYLFYDEANFPKRPSDFAQFLPGIKNKTQITISKTDQWFAFSSSMNYTNAYIIGLALGPDAANGWQGRTYVCINNLWIDI